MQPNQLSPEVVEKLKRMYREVVIKDDLWNKVNSYLANLSRKLNLIILVLTSSKQELGSILVGNIDKIIEDYQNIYNSIQNEEYENLNLYDLVHLPSDIELLLDESGILELINPQNLVNPPL